MKKIAAITIVLGYISFVFEAVPYIGPMWSPWALSIVSPLFVLLIMHFTHGNATWALALVALLTLALPVVVLIAIGWSHYPSFGALLSSYMATFREHGQLWGLEIFSPLLSASLAAVIAGRLRSNLAFKRDALKRAP